MKEPWAVAGRTIVALMTIVAARALIIRFFMVFEVS